MIATPSISLTRCSAGCLAILDQAEDEGRSKALSTEFTKHLETARSLLKDGAGDVAEQRQVDALASEFDRALKAKDFEVAGQKCEDLHALVGRLLRRLPGYWVAVFEYLVERIQAHKLGQVAEALILRGRRHAQDGNGGELAQVCFELSRLLPEGEQKKAESGEIVSHVK